MVNSSKYKLVKGSSFDINQMMFGIKKETVPLLIQPFPENKPMCKICFFGSRYRHLPYCSMNRPFFSIQQFKLFCILSSILGIVRFIRFVTGDSRYYRNPKRSSGIKAVRMCQRIDTYLISGGRGQY